MAYCGIKSLAALETRDPFTPVFSLDRYGFSSVLATQTAVKPGQRVFCDWMHGWIWWREDFGIDDFPGPYVRPGQTRLVTGNEAQALALRSLGHDALAGGLPIIYTPRSGFARQPDTLLAFPTHSSDKVRNKVVQKDYLDFLVSQRNRFRTVCVSLFVYDQQPEIIEEITRRGLMPLMGADPRDRKSLWRTRAALDVFSHVSTNSFGSQVAYALFSGCTTSVFTPVVVNDPRPRAELYGLGEAHIEKKVMVQSEPWLRENFSSLLVQDPREGLWDPALGAAYVGEQCKLNADGIRAAVGWSATSQLKGYARLLRDMPAKQLRRWHRGYVSGAKFRP